MSKPNHNINGFTVHEAADKVGVSDGRIRQLARDGIIESEIVLGRLIISPKGIEQAKARRKTVGRPKTTSVGVKSK